MTNKPNKWVNSLREKIRVECGEGWMVRGIGNGLIQKVQLTVRFEDGTRASILLGPKSKQDPDFVPWVGSSANWILRIARDISITMKSQGKELDEAYEQVKQNEKTRVKESLDWEQMVKRFKSHKRNASEKGPHIWNKNYRTPIDRTLQVLKNEPEATNGCMVLKTLVELHGGATGSASRRLRVHYAAEFLRFAFKNGANKSWLPPRDLSTFIGEKIGTSSLEEIPDH